jgi:hypothetical protein
MVYYFDTSSGKPELIADKDELISFRKDTSALGRAGFITYTKKVSELTQAETDLLYGEFLRDQERLKDKLDGTTK